MSDQANTGTRSYRPPTLSEYARMIQEDRMMGDRDEAAGRLSAYEDTGCPDCTCCPAECCYRGDGSCCPTTHDGEYLCPCTESAW